jgi:hypothetical protein
MSLIQLLTAGKSFCNLEDHLSPYKMTRRHLLPRFDPIRADETQSSAPDAAPVSTMTECRSAVSPAISQACRGAVQPLPHSGVSRTAVAVQRIKSMVDLSRGRWVMAKQTFVGGPEDKSTSRNLQGELALDAVQVKRNDLNDIDLETPRAPSRPPKSTIRKQPPVGSEAGAAWILNRMTARLFGFLIT